MSVIEVFKTMDYGPAPESPAAVNAWLNEHDRQFGLFIDNQWVKSEGIDYYTSYNPASLEKLADTAQAGQAEVDLRRLMGRRLRMIGSVLRSRSLEEKEEIKRRFMDQFWPLLENGIIQPVIDSVYPIQQANEAHERIAAYQNIGKIVLKIRA